MVANLEDIAREEPNTPPPELIPKIVKQLRDSGEVKVVHNDGTVCNHEDVCLNANLFTKEHWDKEEESK